jgi:hypothetical protein
MPTAYGSRPAHADYGSPILLAQNPSAEGRGRGGVGHFGRTAITGDHIKRAFQKSKNHGLEAPATRFRNSL